MMSTEFSSAVPHPHHWMAQAQDANLLQCPSELNDSLKAIT